MSLGQPINILLKKTRKTISEQTRFGGFLLDSYRFIQHIVE